MTVVGMSRQMSNALEIPSRDEHWKANLLAAALEIVNNMRLEIGLDELDQLPKGYRGTSHHCPIACALGAYSIVPSLPAGYIRWEKHDTLPIPLDPILNRLAISFDLGYFPELDAHEQ